MTALRYGDDLIYGDTIYLDALTEEDIKALYPKLNSPESRRRLAEFPIRPEAFEKIYTERKKANTSFVFAVRQREDDALIGICDLFAHNPPSATANCRAELIADAMQHLTETLTVLCRWGFMELNLYRIGAAVAAFDDEWLAALDALGFAQDGRIRDQFWRDDAYHDQVIRSLLVHEWEAQNA